MPNTAPRASRKAAACEWREYYEANPHLTHPQVAAHFGVNLNTMRAAWREFRLYPEGVNLNTYQYEAPDGTKYTGAAAFVLNHLDSAEAALYGETEDGEPESLPRHGKREVFLALGELIKHASILAEYL